MEEVAGVMRRRPMLRRVLNCREPSDDPAERPSPPSPLDFFLMMAWFGMLAGEAELVVVLAQRMLADNVSLESLRTNRHFVWMIPTANLLLFGAAGLILAWLGRRTPGSGPCALLAWLRWSASRSASSPASSGSTQTQGPFSASRWPSRSLAD